MVRQRAAAIGALGVVYGDIGTSPLYALRESLGGEHELDLVEANVLGVLSLMIWSLILVVTVKYLALVLRADNHGEGGILALTALVPEDPSRRRRAALLLVGLFGTALLYGDGMITPAISVLSAVEGLEVAAPSVGGLVVPAAVVILVALFSVQRHGTARIGAVFGPIMLAWFGVLAVLGVSQLVREPAVLAAASPGHAVGFFADNGFTGFLVLGSVFLVVTGGEALYADLGHFGRFPIRLGWYAIVLPALLLNYLGQGALLLRDPTAIEQPFFNLGPSWSVWPLTILATGATVIASQALITGAFSLTVQAINLDYLSRLRVVQTSETTRGQVYVPAVNWALLAACVTLVITFGSSSAMAAAYGVAVTLTMLITTTLFFVVVRDRWGWGRPRALVVLVPIAAVDLAFVGANLFKITAGGWLPLAVGAAIFTLLATWRTGRRLVAERLTGTALPLERFVASVSEDPPPRVSGTAVYLAKASGPTPPALITNFRHHDVLHEHLVVVTVEVHDRPRVPPAQRAQIADLGLGFFRCTLAYGFSDTPSVAADLAALSDRRVSFDPQHTVYFLGRETFDVTGRPAMARWREQLFSAMHRNAAEASDHFGLPPGRTVDVGTHVEL